MKNKPKVVCIGGGTGTFVVLKGLKDYPINLSAVVAMSDSGGSNKRIRDEFGLLPTSDIRQCLVALSDENSGAGLLRKLFMYRFEKGKGISGMTFGNLFMAALSDILGSQKEAVKKTGKVLRIKGEIIPVSYTDTHLYAELENGRVIKGEHFIDEPEHDGKLKISDIYLKPRAKANEDAIDAILRADLVILGPGDLYTSLIPNLIVDKISSAIKKSPARKVYVMNLMTKYGQTYNFTASDHIAALEMYLGKNTIDYVILCTSALNRKALSVYSKTLEHPVRDDFSGNSYFRIIREDLVSRKIVRKDKSDKLVRSLIRHDSQKLAACINRLIKYN